MNKRVSFEWITKPSLERPGRLIIGTNLVVKTYTVYLKQANIILDYEDDLEHYHYIVNLLSSECSCPAFKPLTFCKHIQAVKALRI